MIEDMHDEIDEDTSPLLSDSDDEAFVREHMNDLYFIALRQAVSFTVRTIAPDRYGEEYDKVFRALADQIRERTTIQEC